MEGQQSSFIPTPRQEGPTAGPSHRRSRGLRPPPPQSRDGPAILPIVWGDGWLLFRSMALALVTEGLLVATITSATPAAASSGPFPADMTTLLAPPPSGYAVESNDDATIQLGPLDSDAVANVHSDPSWWGPILLASQFTRGFAGGWRTADQGTELLESVYAFKSWKGALLYWNEDEAYDLDGVSAADRLDDPNIEYSYGVRYREHGTESAWIEFLKGNLVVFVMIRTTDSAAPDAVVLSQVSTQYYITPNSTIEYWSNPLPVTQIIAALIACLIICTGLGFMLMRATSRPRPVRPSVPQGAPTSPDGLWWYDGRSWVPTKPIR